MFPFHFNPDKLHGSFGLKPNEKHPNLTVTAGQVRRQLEKL